MNSIIIQYKQHIWEQLLSFVISKPCLAYGSLQTVCSHICLIVPGCMTNWLSRLSQQMWCKLHIHYSA